LGWNGISILCGESEMNDKLLDIWITKFCDAAMYTKPPPEIYAYNAALLAGFLQELKDYRIKEIKEKNND
jgi:hypothetical protein